MVFDTVPDGMDAFDLDLQQSFCEIGCYRKADPVLERVLKTFEAV